MSEPRTTNLKIINRYGLHARPATDFATAASEYECDIRVRANGEDADGKSVMELMFLAATKGTTLEIICTGPDADDCIARLTTLVNAGFDEDD